MRNWKNLSRALIATAFAAAALGNADAQTPANNRITLIVAFAPGGVADTLARLIAQGLTERTHQTVVVENRAGAGGNIAAELVAHADADGKTLLATTTAIAINETLFTNKKFAASDFKTVAIAASSPASRSHQSRQSTIPGHQKFCWDAADWNRR